MICKLKHAFGQMVLLFELLMLGGCDIHEWPSQQEVVPVHLTVPCNVRNLGWSEVEIWEENSDDVDMEGNQTFVEGVKQGKMRYIVRTVPSSSKSRAEREYYSEEVIIKDVSDLSDLDVSLLLPPGDYDVMVWADYLKPVTDEPYYLAERFSEIKLHGKHEGNNDNHDALRGVGKISVKADIYETEPMDIDIELQRPLAKFEFISVDYQMFMGKELQKNKLQTYAGSNDDVTTRVNLDDYKLVFYYVGYRPDTYSMFTDRPVDAVTGAFFESTIKQLNADEATLGFDYVFISDGVSAVTVQIGLYDKDGNEISMTDPIKVPLKRNLHTKVRGKFLTANASGGIAVLPEYEGDHNLILP